MPLVKNHYSAYAMWGAVFGSGLSIVRGTVTLWVTASGGVGWTRGRCTAALSLERWRIFRLECLDGKRKEPGDDVCWRRTAQL